MTRTQSNKWQPTKGLKEYKYNSTTVATNTHYDIKIVRRKNYSFLNRGSLVLFTTYNCNKTALSRQFLTKEMRRSQTNVPKD